MRSISICYIYHHHFDDRLQLFSSSFLSFFSILHSLALKDFIALALAECFDFDFAGTCLFTTVLVVEVMVVGDVGG